MSKEEGIELAGKGNKHPGESERNVLGCVHGKGETKSSGRNRSKLASLATVAS